MIVYHGSNKIIDKPDVSFSKNYLDFGKGFYVTIYEEQAKKWAKRKAARYGGKPMVSMYELSENMDGFKVLNFKEDDESWLDFVVSCRKGNMDYEKYDIVIGNVADDDVFKSVDMYFKGLWNKERTIEELRYYKRNNQIALLNQKVIDVIIEFKEVYEVK